MMQELTEKVIKLLDDSSLEINKVQICDMIVVVIFIE